MVTLFAIMAMLADYGHWYFPNSPLNWWTAIYGLIAMFSCVMQMVSIWELRRYSRSVTTIGDLAAPLFWDLTLTCGLMLIYSSI